MTWIQALVSANDHWKAFYPVIYGHLTLHAIKLRHLTIIWQQKYKYFICNSLCSSKTVSLSVSIEACDSFPVSMRRTSSFESQLSLLLSSSFNGSSLVPCEAEGFLSSARGAAAGVDEPEDAYLTHKKQIRLNVTDIYSILTIIN